MATDRELIDALCLMQVGWSTDQQGQAYRAAIALLQGHARALRTKQQEDAILTEADAIRARRNTR